jgi:hypothetical protein
MARMNKRNHDKYYRILCERDTERCFICHKTTDEVNLVIDHWDGDNSNNVLSNLHLMCQSDNIKKNSRGKGKMMSPVCVSVCDEERIFSAEFKRNREAEPKFRHWIYDELRENNQMSFDDVLNNGAEYAGCSQEAIKRYLKKMCSREGIMQIMEDERKKWYVVRKEIEELHPNISMEEVKNTNIKRIQKKGTENHDDKLLHMPSVKSAFCGGDNQHQELLSKGG